MNGKYLKHKDFLESFKKVPRIAICLLLRNTKGEALLVKRRIEPYKNYWHYPGSFLLRGEKINDCLKRIYLKELGVDPYIEKVRFNNIFENISGDPRGHVIDLIYTGNLPANYKLNENSENKEFGFFKDIPKRVAFGHSKFLKNVL